MIDPRLLADVKGSEGCRLVAYKDTFGNWTVGYGHKLQDGPDWEGYEIGQDAADALLALDLDGATEQAYHLPEAAGLNPVRLNALTELVFNMGYGKWLTFEKCRRALAQGAFLTAKVELLNSKWAIEVGKARSERLAEMLHTGVYDA